MVSLARFQELRLRLFCAQDSLYTEEHDEHGEYVVESIRGIWFFRPAQEEDVTCTVSIDFRDNSTDCCDAILRALDLPLTREDSPGILVEKLGSPAVFVHDVPSIPSVSYYFSVGAFTICCSYLLPLGPASFWNVEVTNPIFRDSLAYAKEA